jgi:acyl-CoA synthetase (NDP forming)
MIASASAEHYREAIQIVADDPNVDALVAIFIPPLQTRAPEVASAIVEAGRNINGKKPVLTVFMSAKGVPEELKATDVHIPSYAFPEAAAIALARVARYGEWRTRPWSLPPRPEGLRRDEAAAIVAKALGRGGGWLQAEEVHALLSCYGLPLVPQRAVATPDEAALAAEEIGGEVALKGIHPQIVHKTDVGAIRLHLRGAEAVRSAAEEMASHLASQGYTPTAFLVQQMVAKGTEMLLGVVQDPHFGPVVACGAGGLMVEVLGDVAIRLAPLTEHDASDMIRSLKTYPLLTGFRGQPPADVATLQDALLRISALADDLPQIAELDCNPLVVHERGAAIVDARIRVAPFAPSPLLGKRR